MHQASGRRPVPQTHLVPHLVALYARISRDDIGEQTSTARQLRLCRQLADERGWQIVGTHEDVGRSAFAPGVVRGGYERLLDAGRSPLSMNRYRMRGVMPTALEASAVDSHSSTLSVTLVMLQHHPGPLTEGAEEGISGALVSRS